MKDREKIPMPKSKSTVLRVRPNVTTASNLSIPADEAEMSVYSRSLSADKYDRNELAIE